MKNIFLFLFIFCSFFLNAQYPSAGTKIRLGWQTTGDGLVYRGAGAPTFTPTGMNNAWLYMDTDNGDLYGYVSGSWQLVGGGLTMPFDSITFNINEGDASEQELKYSADKGYLQYGGVDSVQIPILPGIWYVRNDTSVTIPKGTVVRASGTLGASGRIKVKHMIANGSIPAMYVLGIAMQDIAVGADGYVMTQGKIRQVNTTAYTEGAVLYADVDTLGGLTQTEPGNGYLKLPIAFVVNSAANGTLAVRIDAGSSLRDLHDVDTTGRVGGSVLRYDSTAGYWKASTTAGIVASDTSVFVRQYQLSGTSGYLPKYTTDTTLGNSVMYESSSKIGIGTTSPEQVLDVNGIARFRHNGGSGGGPIEISDRNSTFSQGINWNVYWTGSAWKYRNSDYGSLFVFGNQGDLAFLNTALGTAEGAPTFRERFRVKEDGTFGIGTDAPSRTLDVNGIARFRHSGGNAGGPIEISDRSGSNTQSLNWNIYYDGTTWRYRNSDYGASLGFTSTGDFAFSNMATGTAGNAVTFRERFRITDAGRVGIGTTSPARSLHISATDAVRIPVGTTAQQSTSANGDIRYNTDKANFEWYSVSGWREPVNAARSPAAGLANRFAKFDANGLLDTSAILIQANNRIGIFNSPAAGDSALTVTGGIRTTTSIRTGSDATINGIRVGRGAGNNSFSIAIGVNALATWSDANIAIGSNALQKNTTGYRNIALGINALQENTDQGNLLAIGLNALQSNTSGYFNVSIGSYSLSKNTSGNNNLAFGGAALENNIDGVNNTALGVFALNSNTSGSYNIAIGSDALKSNSSAQYNTAIGPQAMFANTTGANNFALGAFAFRNNIDGANNTIIGNEAGRYNTAGSNVTKLDNSILIGYDARPSAASGNTGEVVIGYQGRGNGSNTTTIGNSSTTKTFFQYGETYIGTATDNGNYNLQVAGGSYLSGEIKYVNRPAAAGVTNIGVDANGIIREATSSQRFKYNISPYEKGLGDVMKLMPKWYTYNRDTKANAGFIAEDVNDAGLSEYVVYDNENKPYSLQYGNMVALLTKAIQEQQAQIEALKKEIEQLKNK